MSINHGSSAPAFGAGIADPGPLGLAGFAMTTFLLSLANANILHASGEVFGLAIFYGGIAQLLAGLWEFAKGNTFGATAFVSYGAFWLSFYWLVNQTSSGVTAHAVAAYLIGWAIFTAYMTIASLKTTVVIATVFVLLTITFILLAISELGNGHVTIGHWGGYLGLATAAAAWYGSFAVVTNKTWGRTVLPVGPLN